jgi:uncharacterized protein YecT (DUF1311 family)
MRIAHDGGQAGNQPTSKIRLLYDIHQKTRGIFSQTPGEHGFGIRRLFSLSLVAIALCGTPIPAPAADCSDEMMDSYQRAECWDARVKSSEAKARKSYDRALVAAKNVMAECELNLDFRPEIKESQRLWKRWMEKECVLEGGVHLNSIVVEPECRERLTLGRIEALDDMANSLRCKHSSPLSKI